VTGAQHLAPHHRFVVNPWAYTGVTIVILQQALAAVITLEGATVCFAVIQMVTVA
jgi:hypothetical protein